MLEICVACDEIIPADQLAFHGDQPLHRRCLDQAMHEVYHDERDQWDNLHPDSRCPDVRGVS